MDAVDEAFEAVHRSAFLRADNRNSAAEDRPLSIGFGQTSSQPRTVSDMLRLLDVRPGLRVLDVGAGSGWTTALLAHLTGAAGQVVGVELVPELAVWGEQNLRRTAYRWASIRPADPSVLGDPAQAPYDRVLVSAAADRMPQPLLHQLADPGRMVIPVGGRMTLVERAGGRDLFSEHGRYRFVPLVESHRE
jgi:protein-L-isoaspartate(D-aspartate) O-methyltransferase